VSKYRIDFKSSKLLVIFQLVIYVVLVLSVLSWQSDISQYHFFLQLLVAVIVCIIAIIATIHGKRQTQSPVIFSQSGEWVETNIHDQIGWKITNRSRVSNFLLFIHLTSPLNAHDSKWCLVYKDQVSKRDYRRLCRAVIYQHQNVSKD
jgi:hypothetical protein